MPSEAEYVAWAILGVVGAELGRRGMELVHGDSEGVSDAVLLPVRPTLVGWLSAVDEMLVGALVDEESPLGGSTDELKAAEESCCTEGASLLARGRIGRL